jgi:hypothetical protein
MWARLRNRCVYRLRIEHLTIVPNAQSWRLPFRALAPEGVWVDYLNGVTTPETEWPDSQLTRQPLGLLDLMICEILQGLSSDEEAKRVSRELRRFQIFQDRWFSRRTTRRAPPLPWRRAARLGEGRSLPGCPAIGDCDTLSDACATMKAAGGYSHG